MGEILFAAEELERINNKLAAAIAADFAGVSSPLMLLGLLKGCQPFLSDLSRRLSDYHLPLVVDYLRVCSYVGTRSSGRVEISFPTGKWQTPPEQVVVVDDIFDTGLTLKEVIAFLHRQGVRRVKSCVLLRKRGCSRVDFEPDYCGAEIPDAFVVGYGLDCDDKYRELPYIKILEE